MISAFWEYGDGLYGLSASREGGNLHVCTRGHCYLTETFRNFPREIISRDQGVGFEVSKDTSLTEWYANLGLPRRIVHWDACVSVENFDAVVDRFRDGDQSQMLCFDRHSDLYRDADGIEKLRLERMALGL